MRSFGSFIIGALAGALVLFGYLYYYPGHAGNGPAATGATVATVNTARTDTGGGSGIVQVTPDPASNVQVSYPTAALPQVAAPGTPAVDSAAAGAPPAGVAGAAQTGTSGTVPATRAGAPEPGQLLLPVAGVQPNELTDTYTQSRGDHPHDALDIMAPKGTRVLAVADGKIAKLFNSKPGGITIYQYDPTETWSYYYAHLDHYADGLKEGQQVRKGDVIGYVGSTGDADPAAPHLHFGIARLGPDKQWWKGEAINPYPLLSAATPAPKR